MDKLQKLLSLCKCGVYVEVNEHRDVYETVEQKLADEEAREIDPEVRAKMIELNTIVRIQFYPHTPVGFYVIHHYDLEAALDICLQCFEEFPLRQG
jgi:hypothetical protein